MMEALPIIMFLVLLIFILIGYPVAFSLAGTALLFAVIGQIAGVFHPGDLGFIPVRVWGTIQNFTLVAVPLFIFMGMTLSKSGLAEELLETMGKAMRGQRASLAIAVVIVGALLAASTGIAGATVVTMGLMTLPSMINKGYNKELSCGTIAASGTLGQIIPPSIVLVLLGDLMNVDVGNLFISAILPGLLLVGLYLIYIKIRVGMTPSLAPVTNLNEDPIGIKELFSKLIPPGILVVIVLGSILFGIASPTEAAGCGAVGAVLLTLAKKKLTKKKLLDVSNETVNVTSMVFMLLVGAQFFGVVFRGLSGDDVITNLVTTLDVSPAMTLFALMVLFFVLGFFLDFLEICFIVIPIILPVMTNLGYDPLWLAILIAVNLQTSFLTPPFGFALFYLKGVAPKGVTTSDIYRGVIPFVGLQLVALLVIALYPDLVLWLPRVVFAN
jgi:tripartite ATP-independent transporter DctM subunit